VRGGAAEADDPQLQEEGGDFASEVCDQRKVGRTFSANRTRRVRWASAPAKTAIDGQMPYSEKWCSASHALS
jgi:hypothetical protein